MATSTAHSPIRRGETIGIGLADDTIMYAVNRYRLVTTEQLCRALYKKGSFTYARARLAALAQRNFLVKKTLPKTSQGGAPHVYGLGPKGLRYLRSLDVATVNRVR